MRRSLGFLFVLAGASCAIAISSPSPGEATSRTASTKPAATASPHKTAPQKTTPVRLAPADEYFGPLKMSVLGIRNEIHDLGIRYDVKADENHALAKRIMGTALMTEASLADWEKKYPGDGQLARDVYLLQHLYAKIDYDEARTKATYVAKWLVSRYPKTWYGKNMMITLAHILKTPKASVPVTAQQPSPSPTASSVATESPRPVPTATTPSNEPPIPNPARTISPNEPVESVPQATATPEPAGTVAPSPEPSTTAVPAAVRSPR